MKVDVGNIALQLANANVEYGFRDINLEMIYSSIYEIKYNDFFSKLTDIFKRLQTGDYNDDEWRIEFEVVISEDEEKYQKLFSYIYPNQYVLSFTRSSSVVTYKITSCKNNDMEFHIERYDYTGKKTDAFIIEKYMLHVFEKYKKLALFSSQFENFYYECFECIPD